MSVGCRWIVRSLKDPLKFDLTLDREARVELSQQIYEQIKTAILSGRLKPGDRLSSSRELSEELSVSRPTVAVAFEQLSLEGYIEMRHGSGTYVQEGLSAAAAVKRKRGTVGKATRGRSNSDFRREAEQMSPSTRGMESPALSFQYGIPALEEFPNAEWSRLVGRISRNASSGDLAMTGEAFGLVTLRHAIADCLVRFRGLSIKPEQVIVVQGLNQGLDLVARLHLNPGAVVAMEDPGYPLAPRIFRANSGRVVPVGLDDQGLHIEQLKGSSQALLNKAKLIYLTPSHQFPTGITMSLPRRLELLAWAKRSGAIILEDDFDSEYQGTGKPIPALMSLDSNDQVIYSGTFNQLMFPGIGVGYLIVPESLVPLYERGRRLLGEPVNLQLQQCLAEFILRGELERHWRRTRVVYSERRQAFLDALERYTSGLYTVRGEQCGMFVSVTFAGRMTTEAIIKKAAQKNLGLFSTRDFYSRSAAPEREFIFGFGALKETAIVKGVKLLSTILA